MSILGIKMLFGNELGSGTFSSFSIRSSLLSKHFNSAITFYSSSSRSSTEVFLAVIFCCFRTRSELSSSVGELIFCDCYLLKAGVPMLCRLESASMGASSTGLEFDKTNSSLFAVCCIYFFFSSIFCFIFDSRLFSYFSVSFWIFLMVDSTIFALLNLCDSCCFGGLAPSRVSNCCSFSLRQSTFFFNLVSSYGFTTFPQVWL